MNHLGGWIACLLLSSVASAATLSIPNTAVQAPQACHFLSHKSTPIVGSNADHYLGAAREIVKADVLCMGEDVLLDSPVYSNGGDVIIWAARVRISAPIDTRVYINHSQLDYFQDRVNLPGGGFHESADAQLTRWTQLDDRYIRSYRQYFNWCTDCRQLGGATWIPRAPSGLVPAYRVGVGNPQMYMKEGFAPFDDEIDFSALKSGNIYIMADTVEVADSLGSPSTSRDAPQCGSKAPGTYVPYAINASGIRGGRGGAGTPSACTDYAQVSVECRADQYLISGRSGPGGRGGDAGSVALIKVGAPWSVAETDLLRSITSAAGGEPGEHKSFWSPTARGQFAATGAYCDFERNPAGEHQPSRPGADGETIFREMSSNDAVQFLGQLVQEKDARFDYDLSEIAARALSDQTLAQLSFEDYFVLRVANLLAVAEVKATKALSSVLLRKHAIDGGFLPPHLKGLRSESIEGHSLTDRGKVFIRQLSDFSATSEEKALYEYLIASGGLLNVANSRPLDRFQAEALRVDVTSQSQVLTQLQVQLVGIGRTLAEIDIREERRDRLEQLSRLSNVIASAERATSSNTGLSWGADLVNALGKAGKAAGALYANYQSGNAVGLVQSMGSFLSELDKVRSVWAANGADPGILPVLRQELVRLQQEYTAFLAAAAETRRNYHDARVRALSAALRSRGVLASRLQVRHAQFGDLLRMSVASYFADPSKSLRILESNLDSIQVFLTQYPNVEPYFQFRDVDLACHERIGFLGISRLEPACLRVPPQTDVIVLLRIHGSEGAEIDLPLYVLRQGSVERDVRLFGIDPILLPLTSSSLPRRSSSYPDAVLR